MSASQPSRPPGDASSAGETAIPGRADTDAPPPPARADTSRARTWRLEMPAGQALLNANRDLHWMQRNRIVQQLRSDAFYMARYMKIPPLKRARIDATYEPPDRRRRDAANWYPTYKAQIDGLVDAGVLEDDDHTRLEGPVMHIGDVHPGGRTVLIITELPPK